MIVGFVDCFWVDELIGWGSLGQLSELTQYWEKRCKKLSKWCKNIHEDAETKQKLRNRK